MTITLPPELDSRIAQKARAEGLSSQAYVERVIREARAQTQQETASLPEWPGRALSDLRREDLYNDVR